MEKFDFNLIFCLIVQANLVFGVAGLVWPEKFMSLYGILMFPWPPQRTRDSRERAYCDLGMASSPGEDVHNSPVAQPSTESGCGGSPIPASDPALTAN